MALHNICSLSFWSVFFHVILLLFAIANALGNETDRFALLKFKESISGDPYGILSSWNDSVHFCSWPGIVCDRRDQSLIALELEGYGLRGTISPYIGNLSFLRFINLRNNSFFYEIPQQVGRLSRLRHLNLSLNMLEGEIPVDLSHCSQLEIIRIAFNKLTGTIPSELGSMAKLVHLNLESNNLTGGIPPSLGNLSSLEVLSMSYNYLVGAVPDELKSLRSLTFFGVGANSLSGTFPPSLFNMSFVSTFVIAANQLKGTLPFTIGLTLPRLQNFLITSNEFSGIIPESLSNASQLQMLDMGHNNFFGQVPTNLGRLVDLWKINLGFNNLGKFSANSLDFIESLTNCSAAKILSFTSNNFRGVLPRSIANLSTNLSELYFGGNEISGNIPATLENLVNLVILGAEYNHFTGVIPASFGKLQNLQILSLAGNALSGEIPSSIGNLTKVFKLLISNNKLEGRFPLDIANLKKLQLIDIASNRLSGTIPREIFGLPSLLQLMLSGNTLNGSLPVEVGQLKNIVVLNISENNLTSEIPDAVQDCESMEFLDLHGNSFQGALPSALASLRGLQYIDLSHNNLTGKIPKDLEKLRFLFYLNLSFNNLEGEVPYNGVFQNTTVVSVVGNIKLCGGVPTLQLPRCPNEEIKRGKTHSLKLATAIVCVAAVFLLFSGFIILHWRRRSQRTSSPILSKIDLYPRISYKRLYEATDGFSPTMLIGAGSSGSVYKGILDQEGNPIAVKVLNHWKEGAEKSFITECNALRTIRHRNLVKVLTCCSSMDYNGNDFKALVFEYMSHGSLEEWVHPVTDEENQSRGLNLNQRLDIVIDVASALYYLHDGCEQSVIHCDLKPSNVLLDSEMNAHVSDFGLARLISNTNGFSDGQTSTTKIQGTIGYVAPEYATGSEPSKQGDTYSYGILVLETFTGRRPTDERFKDDFNLHNFVKKALPDRLVEIVDSALLPSGSEDTDNGGSEIEQEERNINFENTSQISAHLRECLLSILEIGLACSRESPNDRMKMGDVINELQDIRKVYLNIGVHKQSKEPK